MAKKPELTIEERLKALHNLQVIDTDLKEIEILRGSLPAEVRDLEDAIEGLQTRIERMTVGLNDAKSDIASQNARIKESESLIERYKRQLDDVRNNREYESLNKQISLESLEAQLSQKKIREIEGSLEAKQGAIDKVKERMASREGDLERKRADLEEIMAKTDADEQKLKKKREKAVKKVDARYLRGYDKIRLGYRNGLSVVTVERDACGGCFGKIPPQTRLEISQANKIITCEHCGRILVNDVIAGIAAPEPAAK